MAIDQTPSRSWPLAQRPLLLALCASVLIHALLYGGYKALKPLNWKFPPRLLALLTPSPHRTKLSPKELQPAQQNQKKPDPKQPQQPIEQEPPMMFVFVAPFQETPNPPPQAKFYSEKNSLAANPVIKKKSNDPNLDGKLEHVADSADIERSKKPVELAPTPSPPPQPKVEKQQPKQPPKAPEAKEDLEPKPKPKGGETPGDLAMAKPDPQRKKSDGQADSEKEQQAGQKPHERPRTVAEAKMRLQEANAPMNKMRQEGGVERKLEFSALDAKATPFGSYDAAIVAAIKQRWYDLLDNYKYAADRRGRVVLEFRLHVNGRVSNMTVAENTVGELLSSICQMAITDPAPYPRWPADMQRMVGADFRDVRFTFYYE